MNEAAVLGDSQSSSSTGPCFEYLLKNDLLASLVSLSSLDSPKGSLRCTIRLFTDLIAAMDDTLLCHAAIHKALLKLLKICVLPEGELSQSVASEYELDLVDLMASVSSRLKSYPDLLPIFFRPTPAHLDRVGSPTPTEGSVTSDRASTSTKPSPAEFLLFSFLLRFVHREGQTGDLARVGLLKLIQVAFSTSTTSSMPAPTSTVSKVDYSRREQTIIDLSSRRTVAQSSFGATKPSAHTEFSLLLSEWLLDSDFAEVLGAGLGALYGLLPSKLVGELYHLQGQEVVPSGDFMDEEDDSPTGLGTSTRMRALGLGQIDSEEVSAQRITFLCLLEFTQDVLERISSNTITDREKQLIAGSLRDNILNSVKSIFLDAVLYPSIMECSQVDGSALAVLTYLTDMLDTVQGELASELLTYLIGNPAPPQDPKKHKKTSKLRKRKSSAMMLIEGSLDGQQDRAYMQPSSADRFNLRDILIQNLEPTYAKSKQLQITQTAALQLLSVLLSKHDTFTAPVLGFSEKQAATSFPPQARSDTEDDEEFIYPSEDIELTPSPATQLATCIQRIEHYKSLTTNGQDDEKEYNEHLAHAARILAKEPSFRRSMAAGSASSGQISTTSTNTLMHMLLRQLATFFTHSPAFNLSLTSVLLTLAACPTRSLHGWMLADPTVSDGKQQHNTMQLYEHLANQLRDLRHSQGIDNFDEFEKQRRESFHFVDNLADALLQDDGTGFDQRAGASLPSQLTGHLAPEGPSHLFAEHYAKTANIRIMPPIATALFGEKPANGHQDDESGSEDESQYASKPSSSAEGPHMLSLSTLLDNMSIFEQSLQELTAIIQVRRVCGVDSF